MIDRPDERFADFWEATKAPGHSGHIEWAMRLAPSQRVHYKTYPRLSSLPLPRPRAPRRSLGTVLLTRRSERDFDDRPLSNADLGTLLGLSVGRLASRHARLEHRRVSPSAGGLYPVETYVAVLHSGETASGLYHYNARDHTLELLAGGQIAEEVAVCCVDEWPRAAAALVILSGVFRRSTSKYGPRGYRFALLEAGHLGQNLCLTASAMGLAAAPIGGFDDDRLTSLLDVKLGGELPIYIVAIGPRPSAG